MKFKKGDTAYIKNVGYGLTSFETFEVERVSKGKVFVDCLDYPFDAATGDYITKLPGLGLAVSLCVSPTDIARAKAYVGSPTERGKP